MVGGDGVAEQAKRTRALDILGGAGVHAEVGAEKRRLGDVGGLWPVIDLAGHTLDTLPERQIGTEVGIETLERGGIHCVAHHGRNFMAGRPDVLEIDRPVGALTQWLSFEVLQHCTGDGIGNHQWRRGKEIGFQIGVDARFEIPVAGQHGGGDKVIAGDGFVEFRCQVTGIADAGGAAVASQVEAELFEVWQQPGLGQVIGDDARTGGQRGLDVRLDREAFFNRFLGQQAGSQQHAGVGRVGTTGNGRDQHITRTDIDTVLAGEALVKVLGQLRESVLGRRLGE